MRNSQPNLLKKSTIKFTEFTDDQGNIDTNKQAEAYWNRLIAPQLNNSKKVAFLFSANYQQVKEFKQHYESGKTYIVNGSGQAQLFRELAEKITSEQQSNNVRIIPIPTCELPGGYGQLTQDMVIPALRNLADYLNQGWLVYGIYDENKQRYAIGGGVVEGFDQTPLGKLIGSVLATLTTGTVASNSDYIDHCKLCLTIAAYKQAAQNPDKKQSQHTKIEELTAKVQQNNITNARVERPDSFDMEQHSLLPKLPEESESDSELSKVSSNLGDFNVEDFFKNSDDSEDNKEKSTSSHNSNGIFSTKKRPRDTKDEDEYKQPGEQQGKKPRNV